MKNIKPRLKYLAVLSVASIAVSAQAGVIPGDQGPSNAPSLQSTVRSSIWLLNQQTTDSSSQRERKSGQNAGEVTFTEGVQLNPDPSIAYGFAVIDFGAPSVFGFSFATPIVPTASPTLVASTLAAGLTDFTDNGIALTPTGAEASNERGKRYGHRSALHEHGSRYRACFRGGRWWKRIASCIRVWTVCRGPDSRASRRTVGCTQGRYHL